MDNKIKDTEKIETKNLESIPGENDLPDVKSKEYYENLVTERRMNSYEMRKKAREAASDESIQEVNAEDLDGVAGGKGDVRRLLKDEISDIRLIKYGGPGMYRPRKLSLRERMMLPFLKLEAKIVAKIVDRKIKKERQKWYKCKDIEENERDSPDKI